MNEGVRVRGVCVQGVCVSHVAYECGTESLGVSVGKHRQLSSGEGPELDGAHDP